MNAVHEQSVQQMTLWTVARVLEDDQVAVVARHVVAELGDGGLAVGEQAGAKRRVGPGLGDDARAVLGHPLLLDQMVGLDDELARAHAMLVEHRLDRVDALLDGGDGAGGRERRLTWCGQYRNPRLGRDPRRTAGAFMSKCARARAPQRREGALVIERHLDIASADGAMNTFVVHPEEGGPFPVVLFYMDAPGKREELHDMARRIAAVGYFVVLPNLYYRRSRDYFLKERTEAGNGRDVRAHGDARPRRRPSATRRRCSPSSTPTRPPTASASAPSATAWAGRS